MYFFCVLNTEKEPEKTLVCREQAEAVKSVKLIQSQENTGEPDQEDPCNIWCITLMLCEPLCVNSL